MIKTAECHTELCDEELFNLFQEGDNRAFAELYLRYRAYLVTIAEKMLTSKQMAEDVVQEIFLSLLNRRSEVDIQISLKAYLMKSIKFKVLNEFRSLGVRRAYSDRVSAHNNLSSPYNTNYKCELKDLNSNIKGTINMLPDKCRTAFLLSREEDFSYKEISGYMGISISTVEKHISKALRLLKYNLTVSGFSIN